MLQSLMMHCICVDQLPLLTQNVDDRSNSSNVLHGVQSDEYDKWLTGNQVPGVHLHKSIYQRHLDHMTT